MELKKWSKFQIHLLPSKILPEKIYKMEYRLSHRRHLEGRRLPLRLRQE